MQADWSPLRARRMLITAVCGGSLGCWSACSFAPRVPVTDLGAERYEVNTVSSYEREAHDEAYQAARDFCRQRDKRVEVIEERSKFRGMDQEARAGLAMAGALLGNMVGGYGASNAGRQVRGTTASDEDYRYIVRFTCAEPKAKLKESFFDSL